MADVLVSAERLAALLGVSPSEAAARAAWLSEPTAADDALTVAAFPELAERLERDGRHVPLPPGPQPGFGFDDLRRAPMQSLRS